MESRGELMARSLPVAAEDVTGESWEQRVRVGSFCATGGKFFERDAGDPFHITWVSDQTLQVGFAPQFRMKLRAVNRFAVNSKRLVRNAIGGRQQYRIDGKTIDNVLVADVGAKDGR